MAGKKHQLEKYINTGPTAALKKTGTAAGTNNRRNARIGGKPVAEGMLARARTLATAAKLPQLCQTSHLLSNAHKRDATRYRYK
jgi:hypothetical protein